MKILIFLIGFFLATQISFGQRMVYSDFVFITDSIQNETHADKKKLESIADQFGWESKEIEEARKITFGHDTTNLNKLKTIIENENWNGNELISKKILENLFFIIHFSEQAIIEKYLPLMREVVKKSNVDGSHLAIVEDQFVVGQGKKQIYGSQIKEDKKTHLVYVSPLDDPDNVDKRLAAIRINPLAEYLKAFDIEWDVEQYKKDLPLYELLENKEK